MKLTLVGPFRPSRDSARLEWLVVVVGGGRREGRDRVAVAVAAAGARSFI